MILFFLAQITVAINFISSLDNNEEREMHAKYNNIEIIINEEED